MLNAYRKFRGGASEERCRKNREREVSRSFNQGGKRNNTVKDKKLRVAGATLPGLIAPEGALLPR